ncbi:MAG TPA: HD domain-containing phosphohydrolase, partial [Gaiellaceae bacterium]|nr:HD domain-containing phosphohydrolase [Gaiellaceae bacterium]
MDRSALRLSEVVAALSYALDVADGHDLGHAVRSCVIGMRLADEVGIPVEERSALFYGLLLKDLGCSSNAAKVAAIYGADDQPVKRDVKRIDHRSIPTALAHMWRSVGGTGPRRLANAVGATVRGPGLMKAMTTIRCERGAEIARMLSLPHATAEAILHLDEHWNGRGCPRGLQGEEISLLGRIC